MGCQDSGWHLAVVDVFKLNILHMLTKTLAVNIPFNSNSAWLYPSCLTCVDDSTCVLLATSTTSTTMFDHMPNTHVVVHAYLPCSGACRERQDEWHFL